MKVKRTLPLIKAKYYIIVDYLTSEVTYQSYKYQLRNNKFFAMKWMKKPTKP